MRKSKMFGICFLFIFLFMSVLFITEVAAQADYTMISVPKLRATWFDRMEVGLIQAGKEYNIDVSQQAPASADEAQQVRIMEDAINQGNDAILVVPNDAKSIVPAFARAQNKGIVTITHESPQQENADFDVEMIDNVAYGAKTMEVLVEKMGVEAGKYAVFVGSLTVPAHNIWADAAIARAKEKYPGLEQIATRYPVAEDQNAARQTALDIITANPDIKGFITFGSQGAPGAAQAVREKGLIGKVIVVGGTSPSQAKKYLEDGSLSASIIWDPAEAGYAMVYLAKTVLDGNKDMVDVNFEIPTLGSPLKFVGNTLVHDRPLIITKENIEQYKDF